MVCTHVPTCTYLDCVFKKEGLGKKFKTIGKLLVFWFHFVLKNKIDGGKLDFKNHRGELARAR